MEKDVQCVCGDQPVALNLVVAVKPHEGNLHVKVGCQEGTITVKDAERLRTALDQALAGTWERVVAVEDYIGGPLTKSESTSYVHLDGDGPFYQLFSGGSVCRVNFHPTWEVPRSLQVKVVEVNMAQGVWRQGQ